jgi:hypothetical protein
MDVLMQDLRYAVRSLCGQPSFTLIAVCTLAVGIGLNAAMFSIVDATLLRPIHFGDSDSLMKLTLTRRGFSGRPDREDIRFSYPKYQTFLNHQQIFRDVALYRSVTLNLSGTEHTERVRGELVSACYFTALDIKAEVGRTFVPEEDRPIATQPVALIGHGIWQRSFGGDQDVIGKQISWQSESLHCPEWFPLAPAAVPPLQAGVSKRRLVQSRSCICTLCLLIFSRHWEFH